MSANVVPYDGRGNFDTTGNFQDDYFFYNDDLDFTTAVAEAYAAPSGKDDYDRDRDRDRALAGWAYGGGGRCQWCRGCERWRC